MTSNPTTETRFRMMIAVVASIVLLFVLTPGTANADGNREQEWIVDALRLDEAHKLSQGEGVTIGVIDSGIDAEHPDLKGNIQPGKDFGTSTGEGLNDFDGHGTGVSSLIVGHGHGDGKKDGVIGLAPKAKVVSVGMNLSKVDGEKAGSYIADAITWLVEKDVDIISISMSGYPEATDAVWKAKDKGIPVVASVGNTDKYADDPILGQIEHNTTGWPASDSGAVPVSGTTQSGKFWEGSVDLSGASTQPQFGISAPATDLITAARGGGYANYSGTSGSAPIVAGTLALIKSAYPDLDYSSWMDRLLDTVDDKGPDGFDEKYGWGIVNPQRALTEETVFERRDGSKVVSSPEDRLPLDEQGKESGNSGNGDDENSEDKDGALTPTGSNSLLLPLGIVAAVLILATAVIVIIVVTKRRGMKSQPPAPPRL